jgi:hypothetical protein
VTGYNLEVMAQAERYNGFLLGLVLPHARGRRVLDFGAGSGTFARAGLAIYDRWLFPLSRLLDRALSPLAGKNLILQAHRP